MYQPCEVSVATLDKLSAARVATLKYFPYYATALFYISSYPTKQLETMGVDKYWRLYYNPDFVDKCTIKELVIVLVHELWHLLQQHPTRIKFLDQFSDKLPYWALFEIWRMATDLEINDNLKAFFKDDFIDDALLPKDFKLEDNLLAEEYFRELLKRIKAIVLQIESDDSIPLDSACNSNSQQQSQSSSSGGSKQQQKQQQGSGNSNQDKQQKQQKLRQQIKEKLTANKDEDGDDYGNKKQYKIKESILEKDQGSNVDGIPRDYELGEPNNQNPGVNESKAKLIIRTTAKQIQEYYKSKGDIPAFMQRFVESVLVDKINWRKELRSSLRRSIIQISGNMYKSFKVADRRQGLHQDIIFPGFTAYAPKIGIINDTSGSMSDAELGVAFEYTKQLLKQLQAETIFISMDAEIHVEKNIRSWKDVRKELFIGGGGTELELAMRKLIKMKSPPNIIIMFTDGYTSWLPKEEVPPDIKFIGVTTSDPENFPSYFEKIIRVEPNIYE